MLGEARPLIEGAGLFVWCDPRFAKATSPFYP